MHPMKKINSPSELTEAILLLETRQAEQGKLLLDQFHLTYDSLKPLNLIKSTFKDAAESSELKDNFINTSKGLIVGYLSKLIFEGASKNSLKKMFGSIIMFGITNLVTRNSDSVKKNRD